MEASRKIDIDSKTKEAEVYYSMGLLDESLGVYEQILSNIPDLDTTKQENIQEKIDQLRKEIAVQDEIDTRNVSTQDISKFKKTLTSDENVPAILDSAAAFKDLGLYGEAISEYEKL